MTRCAGRKKSRGMIGHALKHLQIVVVIMPHNSCTGHHLHIRHGFQALGNCSCMVHRTYAINASSRQISYATQRRVFVRQQDTRTCLCCSFSSGQTSQAATHNQHIHMGVHMFVGIWVAFGCSLAQTSGTADDGFVDMLPETLRPHEGLVVKAAGNEARYLIVQCADVECQ